MSLKSERTILRPRHPVAAQKVMNRKRYVELIIMDTIYNLRRTGIRSHFSVQKVIGCEAKVLNL